MDYTTDEKVQFFEEHIKPLTNRIHELCDEKGIEFGAAYYLGKKDEYSACVQSARLLDNTDCPNAFQLGYRIMTGDITPAELMKKASMFSMISNVIECLNNAESESEVSIEISQHH